MKRIGIVVGVFAAALLGGINREGRAQYAFVGDRAVGGPTLQLDVFDQMTGAEKAYFRPAPLVGDMTDLKVGPDGNLYAIQGNSTMLVFNGSTGAFIKSVSLGGYVPWAFTFGPDGNIYISTPVGIYNFIITLQGPNNIPAGSHLGGFIKYFTTTGSPTTSMAFRSGAGGASCNLLCCNGGVISQYDASGNSISDLTLHTAITNFSVGPDGGVYAHAVVPDTVFFNRSHNIIQRFAGSPLQATNWFVGYNFSPSKPDPLGGVYTKQRFYQVWGPDNNLYIAKSKGDNTGTDVIYKVTPATDAAGRPNLGVVGSTTTFVSGLQLPLSMTFLQQPLGAAYPQTYSNQLPFRETGASAWGTGASSITASYFLGPTWDTGGTVSKGVSADILFLGTFGAQVSANTQGKAGLNFSATASAGSVNINYPVQVTMDFGDRNYLFAGDWVSVPTSYQVNGAASLGTLAPNFTARLDAVMSGYFRAEGKAEAFSDTFIDETITPPAGSDPTGNGYFNYGVNILNTDSILSGQTTQKYSLLGGIITGYVKKPVVTAAGMPNPLAADPRIITATGKDTFFNVRGSVSNLVRQIVQNTTGVYVPLGSDDVSEHYLGTGFDLGYSFLDLYANVDVNVKQNFTFAPVPHVKLQMPTGQTVNWRDRNGVQHNSASAIEFDAGDTFQVQMPSDPILHLTPIYTLPNTFTNAISLELNPSLALTPLKLTASGSVAGVSLGSLDWQPIATQTLASTSLDFPITTKTFTLPGFQTLTQPSLTVSGRLHPAPALSSAMPSQLPLTIVPYIYNSTLLPDNVLNSSTQVTIMGITFPPTGAKAYFSIHGSAPVDVNAVYVDACTLHVSIPNKYLLIAGTGQIYVTIPNSTGNSNSLDIQVVNPTPQIKNAGPSVYASDPNLGGNLLLTVTDQSTTFLWSANYYNTIQSKWFASYNGTTTNSNMAAFFPGYDFNAVTPLPAIHLQGSDGVDHTLAMYQEANPSGLLWAVLPLELYSRPDTAQVTVVSPGPGGGVSAPLSLTVGTAVPQIASLSPSVVLPGSGAFRLEVLGPLSPNTPPNPGPYGNFNGASVIWWDGQPLPTTFVTAGDLYADIPASAIATAGTHTVKVVTTVNNGQGSNPSTLTSNSLTFAARSFSPTIAAVRNSPIALYPNAIVSADRAFQGAPNGPQYNLTVNGYDFDTTSIVQLNGTPLATQFVNTTQITATVPYAKVMQPGTAVITIANATAAGGGGTSNPANFTITNAKPGDTVLAPLTLAALSPAFVQNGGSGATVILQGEGFYPGSSVTVNGVARTTTFVSHSALTIALTAADIATAGTTLQIAVTNPAPGGGTPPALPFNVGPSAISGTLTLEGIDSAAPPQTITFLCRPSDNSGILTRTALVSPNGAFTIGGLPKKNYTLHIKSDKTLAANVAADASAGNVTGLQATLLAGDANNDNACNVLDFGALVNAYGSRQSLASSGYDPAPDFNGDGSVDVLDFGLLVNNYGATGAP